MKTTWNIENYKKTVKDEEMTNITFKDYRGEYVINLPTSELRHLLEDLDKKANYAEKLV